MPFPYIFTFYSYKGGVGRSLALLNVAYTLAGWGRHVLVVDMDLEAPGISGFLHGQEEIAAPTAGLPMDVLGLLADAIGMLRSDGKTMVSHEGLPPVVDHLWRVPEDKLTALRPRLGQLGRLDVLGTDLKRDYFGRLSELGLRDLRQDQLIDLSRLLHHYFKAQRFPRRPPGLEAFESAIMTSYDYVLVDSRTGITEVGGLCVGPLADRLVVLTSLNDQNVEGTRSFLDEVGITPEPRPADGKPWDEADAISAEGVGSPSLGPKPTILVASPVPSGEILYKRQRLTELQTRLGVKPLALSYHPQMALIESVFVRDYPEEYLALEYRRLAATLSAHVRDDAQTLTAKTGRLWNEQKQGAAAIECALRLAPQEPAIATVLLQQLGDAVVASDEATRWAKRQLHAHLSAIPELRPTAFRKWGMEIAEWAATKGGEEADRLLVEASRKYDEAHRLDHQDHVLLHFWASVLARRAMTKVGQESASLFAEAGSKYE